MTAFRDDFDGDDLDRSVWVPHYLPAWSSREETRASYRLGESSVTLEIPVDAGLWLPDVHPEPLRVSVMQSGNHSGPVGSRIGQQPFADPLPVREEQDRVEGWLPATGRAAVRCRMDISHRSMGAMWLEGFQDPPDQCGELCVVEVFGKSIEDDSAEVGVGIKAIRDRRLVQDFVAPRLAIDVSEFHEYAVEWDDESATFLVDDQVVHSADRPPTYPLQVMVGVFDFPAWSRGGDDHLVPSMEIDWVAGWSGPVTVNMPR